MGIISSISKSFGVLSDLADWGSESVRDRADIASAERRAELANRYHAAVKSTTTAKLQAWESFQASRRETDKS